MVWDVKSSRKHLLASVASITVAYGHAPVSAQEAEAHPELPPVSIEQTLSETEQSAQTKAAKAKPTPSKKAKVAAKPKKKPAVVPSAPPSQTVEALPFDTSGEFDPDGATTSGPQGDGTVNSAGEGDYKVDRVTSAKFTTPLRDAPQTVSVIPGTIIEERGATTLTEALKNTPGISFNAGENGFATSSSNIQLRGFDASGNIFVDGARDNGVYARDTYNVAGIEVVKGAAADNGRGGAGGYINIVTKTPTLGNFVNAEAVLGFDQYGTEMRKRGTFDVNQSSGTVAVRINGLVEDSGVAGRQEAEANVFGLAPSLAFGLGTEFRAIFSADHLKRRDIPDWGIPGQAVKGTFNYRPALNGIPRDAFFGLKSDYDDVDASSALARFEYDLSDTFTVTNQTRWSTVDRSSGYTAPFGITGNTAETRANFYDRETETITNQTNLAGKFVLGGMKHSLSTGVEVTHETSDADRRPSRSGVSPNPAYFVNPFNPNPDRLQLVTPAVTQVNSVSIDTVAGYLYDTVDLTRQLQLSGGIRVEHYNVDIESRTVAGVPNGVGNFDDSETTVGGKIGLAYKPVEEGTLYAAFGVSGLPPGSFLSNPDISREGDNAFPGFVFGADPVTIHNYEIGAKWDFFGGKLSTTAAIFRTEKKDVAYATRLAGSRSLASDPAIVYGEQIAEGVELGIAGQLTDSLRVFGGLLVMDTERKHGAAVDRAQTAGDYGAVASTKGDELAFTPNVIASLWATYDITERLTFGGGFQYVGESIVGRPDDAQRIIPNGRAGDLPDYFIVNMMTSYKLNENIDLRLNVDNVFNNEYAQSLNWGTTRASLGSSRTFWLTTGFKY